MLPKVIYQPISHDGPPPELHSGKLACTTGLVLLLLCSPFGGAAREPYESSESVQQQQSSKESRNLISVINKLDFEALDQGSSSCDTELATPINLVYALAKAMPHLQPRTTQVILSMLASNSNESTAALAVEKAAARIRTLDNNEYLSIRSQFFPNGESEKKKNKKFLIDCAGIVGSGDSVQPFDTKLNDWLKRNQHSRSAYAINRVTADSEFYDAFVVSSMKARLAWAAPFSISKSKKGLFVHEFTKFVDVREPATFMQSDGIYEFYSSGSMKAIKIPFGTQSPDGTFEALIITSVKAEEALYDINTQAKTMSSWDSNTWNSWLRKFRATRLHLELPRLEIQGMNTTKLPAELESVFESKDARYYCIDKSVEHSDGFALR